MWHEQVVASGDPYFHPPVMEELKEEARRRDLWNLFLPDERYGAGLTNLEYAAAGGDHGPQPHRARGHELRGA